MKIKKNGRESTAPLAETIPLQPDGTSPVKVEQQIRLKQTIGLFTGVNVIVGTIIGSGIFVSPKGVLLESGSVGLSLIIWTACGLVCLIGALCFAELGTCITRSGGQYAYIDETCGRFAAFLYLWAFVIIVMPAANAVIGLTFANYVLQPLFPTCPAPDAAVRILAGLSICLLTFVNCVSVPWATRIQNVFSIVKTLALVLIIITGIVYMISDKGRNFKEPFKDTTTDPGRIALAFYSGMFSYSGWYMLNFLTEEMKNPYRNLPRAIWISMPLVTVIYVMANVAYFAVLTPREILVSDAVAVTFAERMYGVMSWIMPICVACSTFGTLNGGILTCSRLFFVGAREGQLPLAFALINATKFTPVTAVLIEGMISLIFLCTNDVFLLINYVTILEISGFTVCVLGLLYLRYKKPNLHRPIKVNIFFPIVFVIVCVVLVVVPLITAPNEVLIGLGILATGVPVYFIFVLWKEKPLSIKNTSAKFTSFIQKALNAVPQEGKID